MKIEDSVHSSDTIEAVIPKDLHPDLIEIEIQGRGAELVWLDAESAFELGEHLIKLSKQLKEK